MTGTGRLDKDLFEQPIRERLNGQLQYLKLPMKVDESIKRAVGSLLCTPM